MVAPAFTTCLTCGLIIGKTFGHKLTVGLKNVKTALCVQNLGTVLCRNINTPPLSAATRRRKPLGEGSRVRHNVTERACSLMPFGLSPVPAGGGQQIAWNDGAPLSATRKLRRAGRIAPDGVARDTPPVALCVSAPRLRAGWGPPRRGICPNSEER